ncbi:hypothetical protein HF086_015502 [Spodoptera exigua]|uniref:Uncharacterized protein n=1 Tax=Spodoptera exigua TaxID=7107 RepID=A0A922MXH1_SPOEX|nr:hypothetical protein HF086_015502 [Spodoptera exigua]
MMQCCVVAASDILRDPHGAAGVVVLGGVPDVRAHPGAGPVLRRRQRGNHYAIDIKDGCDTLCAGTVLCLVLVYCNLAVIRALYAITAPRGSQPVVRRVSKSSCRQRARAGPAPVHHNAATAEEVAFSRLMATLSVLFMICWLPQMEQRATTELSIVSNEASTGGVPHTLWPHCNTTSLCSATQVASFRIAREVSRQTEIKQRTLFLGLGPPAWPRLAPLSILSDILMLLNYVLNPILYVLMRQRRRLSLTNLCHSIAHCFKRSHKTSTESVSMKASCCPQETLVVSDSSGAELRPLRAPVSLAPYDAQHAA